MLNYEFPPLGGGASPVSYAIAKGYVKLGHSVDVVTMSYKGLPKFEVVDGINVYRVPCLRSKKELCYPWEMLSYVISAKHFLKKHMKTHSYDINHTNFIIPTGIVSLWLKKKHGLPYIITSHGSDIPQYNPDKFVLLHKFTAPLLKKILNNSKGAFAGSMYLAKLGNKIGSNIKYKVIREGFDSSSLKPKKKKKIILSTGRLLPRKGFQYLIKAVSDEALGYEVHIAGDGPMRQELEELAKNSKTKIIFHGWMNNDSKEYKELLETASIFVLASERENSSVALLEAMSAGCAVITSNISGCPETVGNTGLIIPPKDINELKKAIEELATEKQLTKELGKKARKRILTKYDWKEQIKKYVRAISH